MKQRKLGPFTVSSIGLGCMNLSHAYGVPPAADAAADILLRALDLGVTHFDTAALYGFGVNEELVGRTLGPHRSRFTLANKCGIYGVKSETGMRRVIDGRPAALKQNCEDSLRRLRTDVIDLYYLHRWDKSVAIEESMGALSDLVRVGKIRAVGLSEVSAVTLARARRASRRGGAERVLVVHAKPRNSSDRNLPPHWRDIRRIQPAGARLSCRRIVGSDIARRQGPTWRRT